MSKLNRTHKPDKVVDIREEFIKIRQADAQSVFEGLIDGLKEKKCTIRLYGNIRGNKIPMAELVSFGMSWEIEPE